MCFYLILFLLDIHIKNSRERSVLDLIKCANLFRAYSFGVASSVLQMVPFASFLFACTNTVGAALWAANIEAKSGTAPGLREQSKKAT